MNVLAKQRCDTVEDKVDRFINEIYLPNNKELARLSTALENISERFDAYVSSAEQYKKIREEKEAPMIDWFNGITFTKKLLWGFIVGFGTIAATITAVASAYYIILPFIKKLLG